MSLPWVTTVNTVVPTGQSVYPRTVALHRVKLPSGTTDAVGNVGYSGAEQGTGSEGESVLATGLLASIQLASAGRAVHNVGLAGDATNKPTWTIFIPGIAIYTIRDRDIIIDDEGYRYEVGSNEWTPLGYKLNCVRQEA